MFAKYGLLYEDESESLGLLINKTIYLYNIYLLFFKVPLHVNHFFSRSKHI